MMTRFQSRTAYMFSTSVPAAPATWLPPGRIYRKQGLFTDTGTRKRLGLLQRRSPRRSATDHSTSEYAGALRVENGENLSLQ